MSTPRTGKYFYIRSQLNGSLVLELQDGVDKPSVPVVTADARTETEGNDHQLWSFDFATGTLRSKLNSFCMDLKDDVVIAHPYQVGNGQQQWVLDEAEGRIQSQEDFETVIGIEEDSPEAGRSAVAIPYEGMEGQHWSFEYRPAQYFYIRTENHEKVIDVKGASQKPGAKVIIYEDKGDMADNQLWYEDKNGIIRSKLNDFALDASGKDLCILPYDATNEMQQWILSGNHIVNRPHPDKVFTLKGAKGLGVLTSSSIKVAEFTGAVDQMWYCDYIPDQGLSLNHGGNGKHFILRSRLNGLVLEARDAGELGTEIVTSFRSNDPAMAEHQLFFQDDITGTIRTTTNDYCLAVYDDTVIAKPYDPFDKNMQWRVFGKKIQNRHRMEMVMQIAEGCTEPDSTLNVGEYCAHESQHFEVTYQPAKCFVIASLMHGKVFDIKGDDASSGARVIIYDRKPAISANQLWYEDERGIIRSKLNGYALEATGKITKMRPYDPTNNAMQWVIVGDRIQNKLEPKLVLDIEKGSKSKGADVVSYKFHGAENQRWKFDYV